MTATLDIGIYRFQKSVAYLSRDERRMHEGDLVAIPHPMEKYNAACFGVNQQTGKTAALHISNLRLVKTITVPAPADPPLTMPDERRQVALTWARLNAAVRYFQTLNQQQLSI